MNKIKLFSILIIAVLVGFWGCSKKVGPDSIVGKWKAVDFADTSMKSMQIEMTYEFTKDKIINEGSVHGQSLQKLEVPYVVKSVEGNTIVLEATHPQSQQKGEFKCVLEGNKITMTDPNQIVMTLEKQ